jgi:4-hydroxybenzoate polyprenyltransferase
MSVSDICRLVSVEYLPPMIMAFIVGLVFAGGTSNIPHLIFALLSVAFLVVGFNSFNAIYDKTIDTINKPTRPIPS